MTEDAGEVSAAAASLLDVLDELTEAKNFVGCVVLACSSQRLPYAERAALCAVGDAARTKLEAVHGAIAQLVGDKHSGQALDSV